MKTTVTYLIISLFFSLASYASNGKTKVLTNLIDNVKECILVDSKTLTPRERIVYTYDNNDLTIERISYLWHKAQGWKAFQKHEYKYISNELAMYIYTKWDRKSNDWSAESEYVIHNYDVSGKLLSIERKLIHRDTIM